MLRVKWDWLDFLDRLEAMVFLGDLAYQVPLDRLDRPVRMARKDSEDSRARRDSKETRGPMVRLEQQALEVPVDLREQLDFPEIVESLVFSAIQGPKERRGQGVLLVHLGPPEHKESQVHRG